jgi:hypothetical protein|tara:strand:+ start:669 stop:1100 length:432 start_codon:yes stop_codon:yes gene_type:complete
MAGIVGLTELQHTSGNSAMTITTSGDVNVKGEGTNTTNLRQGLVKHWATINNGDTVADSFNQSSITDNDPSDCTYNFATAMGNANYSNSFAATYNHDTNPYRTLGYFASAPTTAAFRTHGFYSTTMATNDMSISTVGTFGDLS